jgi:acetyl esterase/lipase
MPRFVKRTLFLGALALAITLRAGGGTGDVRKLSVAYGPDERQSFDVYAPPDANGAPVIFMVHGGAWIIGDKTNRRTVENKVAHWVPKGFVVISANYRMLPEADPLEQARDVALAVAAAQKEARTYGADPDKFVLMGHSAGAHLVTLLAASRDVRAEAKPAPWLGTVSLDTGTHDVLATMENPHPRLYDRAFGTDPKFWRDVSPLAHLERGAAPFLLVCSTRRSDSCPQGDAFAAKARELGVRAEVLKKDFSHAEINARLGEERAYTAAVDAFLASLDAELAARLNARAP